jgi:hypothetical protein
MTYLEAEQEKKRLDNLWAGYIGSHYEKGHILLGEIFRDHPDCPTNRHVIKCLGREHEQPVISEYGVTFLPSAVLAINPEFVATFPTVSLDILNEDTWFVRATKDDYEW